MILFIKIFHIVVADDVQPVGEGLGSFFPKVLHSLVPGVLHLVHAPGQRVVQSAPEGADPVADRPGSVQIPDGFRQFFRQGISVVQSAALWNLISRGPQNHARMGPVPANKSCQILFPVLRKKLAVVPAPLGNAPGVKGLVKNIHAKPVAGLNQRCRRRIVRCPDRVESALFQFPYFPCFRFIQGNRAKQPVVVVQASALQLDGLPVDPQSPHAVRGDGPDPEQHLGLVGRFCFVFLKMCPEPSDVCHPRRHAVKVRMLRVPKQRFRYVDGDPCRSAAPGVHLNNPF